MDTTNNAKLTIQTSIRQQYLCTLSYNVTKHPISNEPLIK